MAVAKKKKVIDPLNDQNNGVNQSAADQLKTLPGAVPPARTIPPAQTPGQITGGSSSVTTQPEILRDEKGNINGLKLPDGRTFVGIGRNEVNGLVANYLKQTATPQGAIEGQAVEQQKRIAEGKAQAAAQLIGGLGGPAQAQYDLGNAGNLLDPTTAIKNIPSIAGGIAGGATIGAGIGTAVPILGTAIGAVAGGIIGGITAYSGKLAIDKRQSVKNANALFSTQASRDRELLNLANSGQATPAELIQAYDIKLANTREAERSLKALTKGKVNEQLSGAMDDLIKIQEYLAHEPEMRAQLVNAIQNPNPNLLYPVTQDLNSLDTTQ